MCEQQMAKTKLSSNRDIGAAAGATRMSVGTATLLLLFMLMVVADTSKAAALPGPPVFEQIGHYPSFCYLPPESGLCQSGNATSSATTTAAIAIDQKLRPGTASEDDEATAQQPQLLTRFYFDSVTAQCYPFGAQECGGNDNRFQSQADCMATCKLTSST